MARYDDTDEFSAFLAGFGLLANSFDASPDGDTGASFPKSDALDFAAGARFIPNEVTLERRAGRAITFRQPCANRCCWYWEFPDRSRTYHWDRGAWEAIARANGQTWTGEFAGDAGACPACGNPHTHGGQVRPDGTGVAT